LIIFLISLVVLALTVILYYKTPALLPLRAVCIILLYVLISGFVLSYTANKKKNPAVLLVDHSGSMTKYLDHVDSVLTAVDFTGQKFYFSETLFTEDPVESIVSNRFTDIGRVIEKAAKMDPSAIILISDGNHNYGHFPFSKIKAYAIPVYCFGIGSEKISDLAIIDISYPSFVFLNDSIKVTAVVESQGFSKNQKSIISLHYNKKINDRSLLLSDIRSKTDLEFRVFIDQPENAVLTLDAKHQPEEVNYENNHAQLSLKVLQNKIKVVYYTGHLSFNTKFMARTMDQDDYIDLIAIARINKDVYFDLIRDKKLGTLPDIDDVDVMILDNADLKDLPWSGMINMIEKGMGLFCIGTIQNQDRPWNEILPINTTAALIKRDFPLQVNEPFSCLIPGDDYPPFTAINRVININDKAVIIAQSNNIPLIAYQNYGLGTVFQINVLDLGTWQFVQLGLKQKNIFTLLIGDIIRFLSPLGKNKRLFLSTLKTRYNIGENIILNLQSYDRNYRLQSGGDFFFQYKDMDIPFFETGNGRYEASFIPDQKGDIVLNASGDLDNEKLNSNTLKLSVIGTALEADKGLNQDFLVALSKQSGGAFFHLDEINDFELPRTDNVKQRMRIDLDSPITYVLIFLLLAIDWIIRRRRGTI
jgi:hypothetical protein